MAIDTGSGDLGHLDHAIHKVELKVTLLAADEEKVQALLQKDGAGRSGARCTSTTRKALALYGEHLVPRARVTQGDNDHSTVKLRPVELADDQASWRRIDGIRIELDVVGGERVPSAKLDGNPDRVRSRESRRNGALSVRCSPASRRSSSPTRRRTVSRYVGSRSWAQSTRTSGTSTIRKDSRTRPASRSGLCRTRLTSSSFRSRFPPTKRTTRKRRSAPSCAGRSDAEDAGVLRFFADRLGDWASNRISCVDGWPQPSEDARPSSSTLGRPGGRAAQWVDGLSCPCRRTLGPASVAIVDAITTTGAPGAASRRHRALPSVIDHVNVSLATPGWPLSMT